MSDLTKRRSGTVWQTAQRYGLLAIAAGYVAGAIWTTQRLHGRHEVLLREKEEISTKPPAIKEHLADFESSASGTETPIELEVRLKNLQTRLAAETSAAKAAETQVTKLEAQTTTKEDEVTASFGRIDEMASATGGLLRMLSSLVADPKWLEKPEMSKQFTEAFTDFMKKSALLKDFEDRPADIARFQVALLRDFVGLDNQQSGEVNEALRREFAALQEQGLSASQKPSEPAAEVVWCKNRDEAVKQMAARIAPLLHASLEKQAMLPGILNLGEGMRLQTTVLPGGHGSMRAVLPGFALPGPGGN